MDKVATILHVEYGDAIRNSNKDGLEHNGYVDGVSQPLFLKDEVDEYVKQHDIKRGVGLPNDGFAFNPIKTPALVLLKDPYVKENEGIYGSYFVFRKLEQEVRAFKKQESKIGTAIYGKHAEEKERAGAMLVGRFEDGTPIQVQGEDKLIGSGAFNNFNYESSGGLCPHFAHIRKTNPRTVEGKNIYQFDDHAMARRGIPYGHRNVNTELNEIQDDQFPVDGVGLLFMSYQQSIVTQFEVIQKRANFNDASSSGFKDGGVDPVIGQTPKGINRTSYEFPDDALHSHQFDQHIHFKGGEYFFAPSMAYLDQLIS
jgi:Dyp-type peroxidase family